jgi:predicted dehydrogenase
VLVEAFMYRSHPQTAKILQSIRDGAIGQVKLIKTSFCYRTTKIDGNIRFSRELHGGGVMDVGCYCINFSRLIAGMEPDRVLAAGKMHENGVDEWAGGTLGFANGMIANFVCGMTVQADNTAYVCGTEGYLQIPWPWKPPKQATFTIAHSIPPRQDSANSTAGNRPPREDVTVETERELYALEADDFAATVLDHAPPALSREDSVGNMRVLDEVRRQMGMGF